jgi:hypothetical protein
MKQRLGGLLALGLGVVLLTSGLSDSMSGGVGNVVPSCGEINIGGLPVTCPTGTITVTETTTPTPIAGDPTPPVGGWQVAVTSTCLDPSTGLATNLTLSVADGGHSVTHQLEIFTNTADTTSCSYALAEVAVTGFTATFTPASPVTIPNSVDLGRNKNVALANTFVRATPTPTPTPTPSSTPVSSSSSAVLADTGPRTQISASIWIGSALCVLGLVMLFGSNFRRRGTHA